MREVPLYRPETRNPKHSGEGESRGDVSGGESDQGGRLDGQARGLYRSAIQELCYAHVYAFVPHTQDVKFRIVRLHLSRRTCDTWSARGLYRSAIQGSSGCQSAKS